MEKDKEITDVIFRKFKDNNEIIALFPHIPNGRFTLCYMHLGQHGDCEYNHVINGTKLATEAEYKDLKAELENHCGYNLKVIKRFNYKKYNDNKPKPNFA